MDDYGVEYAQTTKKEAANNQSADSKNTADKTPSANINKQMGKLGLQGGDVQQIGDYGVEQLSTTAKPFVPGGGSQAMYQKHLKGQSPSATPVDDDVDEEDLYAQPIQITHNKEASADYIAQMANQEQSEKYVPEDTLFVFTQQDFLYLDFVNDTWAQGDIIQMPGTAPLSIPQNSSIVKVNRELHKCVHSHIFVTGGVNTSGQLLNWAFGGKFFESQEMGQKNMTFAMSFSDAEFMLPIQRMMHESCIVRNQKSEFVLLVLGGKVGVQQSNCSFTNSVVSFDLKYVFQPWLRTKLEGENPPPLSWQSLESMKNPRCNFGLTVCENFVYVYGGIQAKGEKPDVHVPKLCDVLIEKYDPCQNVWTSVDVKGAIPLAAFAYTVLPPDSGRIMILGGTDGDIIQENQWIIDFKNEKAEPQSSSIEQPLAMGKLIYREKSNTLYSIGGYGSSGQNFQMKFKSGAEWEEFSRSHTALLSPSTGSEELELVHLSSVFFQ